MNRKKVDFWNIKDNRLNAKPIIDAQAKADMVFLRGRLADTAAKFKEIAGNIAALTAHMTSSKDRYWGNELIEVVISRSENDENLIEVHYQDDPDQNNPSITFGFEKPEKWTNPIHLEPYCASGQKEAIVSLSVLLLGEWRSCVRMKYRTIKTPIFHQ